MVETVDKSTTRARSLASYVHAKNEPETLETVEKQKGRVLVGDHDSLKASLFLSFFY